MGKELDTEFQRELIKNAQDIVHDYNEEEDCHFDLVVRGALWMHKKLTGQVKKQTDTNTNTIKNTFSNVRYVTLESNLQETNNELEDKKLITECILNLANSWSIVYNSNDSFFRDEMMELMTKLRKQLKTKI